MKRKLVGILITLLMIVATIQVVGFQIVENSNMRMSETTDWPMFHCDVLNTGYSTSSAPVNNTTLWNFVTGGSIVSCPAVIADNVYVGSNDGKLYCFDARDGDEKWSFTTQGAVRSSPTVIDDMVYFGSDDYKIYCLNASDGTHIWNFTTDGKVYSSPVIADGKVLVGSAQYGGLYCLDADPSDELDEGFDDPDGSIYDLLWIYEPGGWVTCTPAVVDGSGYIVVIYPNSARLELVKFELETGIVEWYNQTGPWYNTDGTEMIPGGSSSPAVIDNRVYVGSDSGDVYCFNAIDGTQIWKTAIGDGLLSSPAVFNGSVYIGQDDSSKHIVCLDSSDGSEEWSMSFDSEDSDGIVRSSPAVADGKVYIGSDDNNIYCLNAENGSMIWNYATEGPVRSSPAIANGDVFIGSIDGMIYCFGLDSTPNEPTIIGPTVGGPNIDFNFSVMSSYLPDGDEVEAYYMIDWNDGNITDWLGPFDPLENITVNYTWIDEGNYGIKVKTKSKDSEENWWESDWSESHIISIATQIEFSNIQKGYVYFRTFFANNSYAYIYLLETLGVTVMLSDMGLSVETTATDAVDAVAFELIDLLWDDQINQEDDNSTDGFSAYFELSTGIFQITVYSYDENGTLIDMDKLDYLLFIGLRGGDNPENLNPIQKIRHRMRDRIQSKIQDRLLG